MSKSVVKRLEAQLAEASREDLIRMLAAREAHPTHRVAALMTEYRWTWRESPQQQGLIDLIDAAGRVLGWVQPRPVYCDRGHWQANVQCVPDLDEQDNFPRYYLRQATAQNEIVEFLAWRLFKKRAE